MLATLLASVSMQAPADAQDAETNEIAPDISEETPDTELEITSISRDEDTGRVSIEAVAPVDLAGGRLPGSAVSILVDDSFQDVTYEPVATDALQVVLVLDVSGSMLGEPLEAAKAAAVSFIDRLPPTVRVGVIAFDDTPDVIAEVGTPSDVVIKAINNLQVGGKTALYDALLLAIDEFEPASSKDRKVVVALTDGSDRSSSVEPDFVSDEMVRTGIELHGVALETNEPGSEALALLVDETNGTFTRAESADALLPLYDDLAARLGSRFTVSFTPERARRNSALVVVSHAGVIASVSADYRAIQPPRPAPASTPRTATNAVPEIVSQREIDATLVGESGWLATATARNVGIGAVAAMLLIIGLLLSFPTKKVGRLTAARHDKSPALKVTNLTGRLESFADRRLESKGRRRRLTRALERAGLDLRPAEFLVIAGATALATAMTASLIIGTFGSILVFIGTVFATRFYVAHKARARTAMFLEQLPGTLQLIAGALRAGYALPQAAETVAAETDSPTCDEFHRLVTEHRLGRDFGEALHAMDERLGQEDFKWVVQALDIHREVGGDLAEVLDNVNRTMRDRSFIRRQVAAVSAEGRYSAYLIVSLPFLVTGVLFLTNPAYIGKLFDGLRGLMAVTLAVGLVTIGSLWMKVLMKVRF